MTIRGPRRTETASRGQRLAYPVSRWLVFDEAALIRCDGAMRNASPTGARSAISAIYMACRRVQ